MQVGLAGPGANIFSTVSTVYRAEGMRALWRGAAARALHLAPGMGITIAVFQLVADALKSRGSG